VKYLGHKRVDLRQGRHTIQNLNAVPTHINHPSNIA